MSEFSPMLRSLSAPQLRLLDELADLPSDFVLYGGTGLALRLGHRTSADFDFFSHAPLDRVALTRALGWLDRAAVLDETAQSLTVSVDHGGPVKVSFFGAIDFGRVAMPESLAGRSVQVASLLDLGATKVKVLLQRVESKDYLDVDALLRAGVPLEDLLGAARALFGETFNPLVARKALAYFEGGDLDRLDAQLRARLTRAALADVEPTQLIRRSGALRGP